MSDDIENMEDETQTVRQQLVKEREDEMKRLDSDTEVEIINAVRAPGADGGPITPTRLTAADSFCFSCHKGVSCWNKCCHGADIKIGRAHV